MHTMRFNAGVFYNGEMRINEYTFRIWMTTNSHDPTNHNISYERIKYFVYHELDSTIFINSEQKEQCQMYVAAGLDITTMPGDPVDQLVGIMLYYKLNAIMEDRMIVYETELSSTMGDGMVYLHSDNETTTTVDQPDWWTSVDPVHCDVELMGSDNVVALHRASAWRELDLAWADGNDTTSDDNTVVFADFKKTDDTK